MQNTCQPDILNPCKEPVPLHPRIAQLKERFNRNGFRVNDASNTPEFPFHYSASKVRFDFVGYPTFVEEFFIFQGLEEVTMPRCREFIDQAWEWALANENTMPESAELSKSALRFATQFLHGRHSIVSKKFDQMSVREVTCLIYVYAIAVSARVASDALEWIWSKKSAAIRKHATQLNFIVPVIYKTSTEEFHHFKKRPLLRSAFYSEARKVMKKHLIE